MFVQSALTAEIGKLQKFATRLTGNKSDADDLVQSTCLRAIEKSDYFEDGTNLFGWTSKIMFNIFASQYRRRTKYESRMDSEDCLDRIAVPADQEVRMELSNVNRALLKLSPEHRQILTLLCVKGLQYQEVSELLHIPVGTVRSRRARASEQLRQIMHMPKIEAHANTNGHLPDQYLAS